MKSLTPTDIINALNTLDTVGNALTSNGQQIQALYTQLSSGITVLQRFFATKGCTAGIGAVEVFMAGLIVTNENFDACLPDVVNATSMADRTDALWQFIVTGNSSTDVPVSALQSAQQDMATSAANLDAVLAAAGQTTGPASALSILLHAYATLLPQVIEAADVIGRFQTVVYEEAAKLILWVSSDTSDSRSDEDMPYTVKTFKYINSTGFDTDATLISQAKVASLTPNDQLLKGMST
ncbi:hypothetical protein EIP91_001575 [Steccherinum ochraceum]|uniref:Uncharacterized protein n=1 Tax=Steccherinum ochraceum TaxID=92696 RepID=A0A4R0RUD9_9APHY|nr:hypothetical protein EIP91_001575 [Steccherinum ochraceum]